MKNEVAMKLSFICGKNNPEKNTIVLNCENFILTTNTASVTLDLKNPELLKEFNKIIVNLKKNREQSKNHNNYWLNTIYGYYQTGINTADPKNYEDILNKLTPKDIQKFAKALYNKKTDIVDIIFKPKAK